MKRIIGFCISVCLCLFVHSQTLNHESGIKPEDIDWESEDKKTFIGAFNFLYRKIKEANPNVIVAIGGISRIPVHSAIR